MKIEKREVVVFDNGTEKVIKNLDGWDWCWLLREQPQFINKADLNTDIVNQIKEVAKSDHIAVLAEIPFDRNILYL